MWINMTLEIHFNQNKQTETNITYLVHAKDALYHLLKIVNGNVIRLEQAEQTRPTKQKQ